MQSLAVSMFCGGAISVTDLEQIAGPWGDDDDTDKIVVLVP
jgi:hypothetical protein